MQCAGTPFILNHLSFFEDLKELDISRGTTAKIFSFLQCVTSLCECYISVFTPRSLLVLSGERRRLPLARSILSLEIVRAYGSHSSCGVWAFNSSTFYILSSTGQFIFIYKFLSRTSGVGSKLSCHKKPTQRSTQHEYHDEHQTSAKVSRQEKEASGNPNQFDVQVSETSSSEMFENYADYNENDDILTCVLQSSGCPPSTYVSGHSAKPQSHWRGVRRGAWQKMVLVEEHQAFKRMSESDRLFLAHTVKTRGPVSSLLVSSVGLVCCSLTGPSFFVMSETNPLTTLLVISLSDFSLISDPNLPWYATHSHKKDSLLDNSWNPNYFSAYLVNPRDQSEALISFSQLKPHAPSPQFSKFDCSIVDFQLSEIHNLLAVVLSNGSAALFVWKSTSVSSLADVHQTCQSSSMPSNQSPADSVMRFAKGSPGVLLASWGIQCVRFNETKDLLAVGLLNGSVHGVHFDACCGSQLIKNKWIVFQVEPKLLLKNCLSTSYKTEPPSTISTCQWSRCGESLAIGWNTGGPVVVSSTGVIIMSALPYSTSNMTMNSVSSSTVERQQRHSITTLEWTLAGLSLLVITTCSPHLITELPFYRSTPIRAKNLCYDRQQTVLRTYGSERVLIGAHKLLVNRSGSKQHETSPWMEIPLPSYHYMKRNWPLCSAIESPNRKCILVTGGRGVALYSFGSSRWCLFGNKHHERYYKINHLPIGWYSSCLFFLCSRHISVPKTFSLQEFLSGRKQRIQETPSFLNLFAYNPITKNAMVKEAENNHFSGDHYMISFFDIRQPLDQELVVAELKMPNVLPLYVFLFSLGDRFRPGWRSTENVTIHGEAPEILLNDPCMFSGIHNEFHSGLTANSTSGSQIALETLQYPPILAVYNASFHLNAYILVPSKTVNSCQPVQSIIPHWIPQHIWTVDLSSSLWKSHPIRMVFLGCPYHILVHHADLSVSSIQLRPASSHSVTPGTEIKTLKHMSPISSQGVPSSDLTYFTKQHCEELKSICVLTSFKDTVLDGEKQVTVLDFVESKPFLQGVIQFWNSPEAQFSKFFPLPVISFDPFCPSNLRYPLADTCKAHAPQHSSFCGNLKKDGTLQLDENVFETKCSPSCAPDHGFHDASYHQRNEKSFRCSSTSKLMVNRSCVNEITDNSTAPYKQSPPRYFLYRERHMEPPYKISSLKDINGLIQSIDSRGSRRSRSLSWDHLSRRKRFTKLFDNSSTDVSDSSAKLFPNTELRNSFEDSALNFSPNMNAFKTFALHNTPGRYILCETLTYFYLIAVSAHDSSHSDLTNPDHSFLRAKQTRPIEDFKGDKTNHYQYFLMKIYKRAEDVTMPIVTYIVNGAAGVVSHHTTLTTPTRILIHDPMSYNTQPFYIVTQLHMTELPLAQSILTSFLSLDAHENFTLGYDLALSFCEMLKGSSRFVQILKVLLKQFLLDAVSVFQQELKCLNDSPHILLSRLFKTNSSGGIEKPNVQWTNADSYKINKKALEAIQAIEAVLQRTSLNNAFTWLDVSANCVKLEDGFAFLQSLLQQPMKESDIECITPSLIAHQIFSKEAIQCCKELFQSTEPCLDQPLNLLLRFIRFLHHDYPCIRILAGFFNLIKNYPLFAPYVIVCALRETDPTLSPALLYFFFNQSIEALYQSQILELNFHVASLSILILQNLLGPLLTRILFILPLFRHALGHNIFILAKKLLHFYLCIYNFSSSPQASNSAKLISSTQLNAEQLSFSSPPQSNKPNTHCKPQFNYSKPLTLSDPPHYPLIISDIISDEGILLAQQALDSLEKCLLNSMLQCVQQSEWIRLIAHVKFLKLDLISWLQPARQQILQDMSFIELGIEMEFYRMFPTTQSPRNEVNQSHLMDSTLDASKFLELILSFRKQFVCDFVKMNLSNLRNHSNEPQYHVASPSSSDLTKHTKQRFECREKENVSHKNPFNFLPQQPTDFSYDSSPTLSHPTNNTPVEMSDQKILLPTDSKNHDLNPLFDAHQSLPNSTRSFFSSFTSSAPITNYQGTKHCDSVQRHRSLSLASSILSRQNACHRHSQDFLQLLVSCFIELNIYILPMAIALSTCDLNLLQYLHTKTPKSKILTYQFICCRGHELNPY